MLQSQCFSGAGSHLDFELQTSLQVVTSWVLLEVHRRWWLRAVVWCWERDALFYSLLAASALIVCAILHFTSIFVKFLMHWSLAFVTLETLMDILCLHVVNYGVKTFLLHIAQHHCAASLSISCNVCYYLEPLLIFIMIYILDFYSCYNFFGLNQWPPA